MSKPHSFQYHLGGSYTITGAMICSECNKDISPISAFRTSQKSVGKYDDWKYVTCHKSCCLDDPEWNKIANRELAHKQAKEDIEKAAIKLSKETGIKDPYEFASIVFAALGGDSEQFNY